MDVFLDDNGAVFVEMEWGHWLCIGHASELEKATPHERNQMLLEAMMIAFENEHPELFPKGARPEMQH